MFLPKSCVKLEIRCFEVVISSFSHLAWRHIKQFCQYLNDRSRINIVLCIYIVVSVCPTPYRNNETMTIKVLWIIRTQQSLVEIKFSILIKFSKLVNNDRLRCIQGRTCPNGQTCVSVVAPCTSPPCRRVGECVRKSKWKNMVWVFRCRVKTVFIIDSTEKAPDSANCMTY